MRYIQKILIPIILIFSSITYGNVVEITNDVFLSFQVDDVELYAGDTTQINVNARLLNYSASQFDFNASDYLGPSVSFNTGGLISSPGNTNGLYKWTSFLPEASSNPNLGSLSLAPGESYEFNYGTLTPTTSNTSIGTYESDIGLSYFYNYTTPAETLKDTLTVTINSNTSEVMQEDASNPIDIYGLFIGWNDPVSDILDGLLPMRGQADASSVRNAMIDNLGASEDNLLYLALDQSNNSTKSEIEEMIDSFFDPSNPQVDENDLFVIYIAAHGGDDFADDGENGTGTIGDEAVLTGGGPAITDDDLAKWLNNYQDTNKLVILDSCHSGGFWGNNLETGGGFDLSQVPNTSLIASATEIGTSASNQTGRSYFSQAIVDAFEDNSSGFYNADADNVDNITALELNNYINEWYGFYVWNDLSDQDIFVGVRDHIHGEQVLLTEDLLTSQYFSNSDLMARFPSELDNNTVFVSEPPLYMLILTGMIPLVLSFKFKKKIC